MTENASLQEEEALRGQLKAGISPECPKCRTALGITPVPPRSDVSYVRDRVLLQCGSCGLKVSLDRR